ncbi:site-2 protease family protein [Corynebacterium uberis]|uniref:M50 family metallopeptidase n=1 Tax=Corynebacterium uberis TaxID=2883169 RepID=UPI001D0A40ED|nr:site-2 protease family protein [Corynebacterium uberis]UDL79519.1 site-2 protease family protein [Corynebacterium uberis]
MSSYIIGVALFAVGITAAIALHEAGHLLAARAFGMRVRRYFIGFGPRVWSFRRGHTEYGLAALPFGGFCDIAGMTAQDELTPEEAPHAMVNKPAWARVIVLLGGIAMNLLIGVVVCYGLAVSSGLPNPNMDRTATVGELTCVADQQADGELAPCQGNGPAAAAGLRVDDRVLKVNGEPVDSFVELAQRVREHPDESVALTVERAGERAVVTVPVARVVRVDEEGRQVTVGAIGVASAVPKDAVVTYGPGEGVGAALSYSATVLGQTGQALVGLPARIPGVAAAIFGAQRDVESPMSVVGAARVGGELAQRDQWPMFWMMLAGLNFFLAVFNLIPLPPFDGGHVAVVCVEVVRNWWRRLRGLAPAGPVDYSRIMPVTYAIAATLLALGVVFIVADVVNPVRLF